MQCDFPRARSLVCISSSRIHKRTGKPLAPLCRYFISSHRPEDLTPDQWIQAVRGHWGGVEIRNHWTRDAILREDHTRSRNPILVGALAMLRSALLAIYARLRENHPCLPAILENLRANPHLCRRLIMEKL